MTIDILFIQNSKPVLRVNMGCSNLYCKILSELTHEEIEKWIPNFHANRTFSDKEFIEKVWNLCVMHGYISKDYDILGKFLDKMEIIIGSNQYQQVLVA